MTETVNQPRIVVGIDGSESSKQALRWAVEQARLVGATVDAITVWEDPAQFGWIPVVDVEGLDKACKQTLAETVAEVAGGQPSVSIHSRVIGGHHPAYVLIREAEGAQLLVLGSRGHGGFVGALLGSVSQHCVQHAACPVVVIRNPRR
jgi:nucleotide-binding universal stress UspA family protein